MMEHDGNPYDYYSGIAAKLRALSDPADPRAQWEEIRDTYTGGLEETRAKTDH